MGMNSALPTGSILSSHPGRLCQEGSSALVSLPVYFTLISLQCDATLGKPKRARSLALLQRTLQVIAADSDRSNSGGSPLQRQQVQLMRANDHYICSMLQANSHWRIMYTTVLKQLKMYWNFCTCIVNTQERNYFKKLTWHVSTCVHLLAGLSAGLQKNHWTSTELVWWLESR